MHFSSFADLEEERLVYSKGKKYTLLEKFKNPLNTYIVYPHS